MNVPARRGLPALLALTVALALALACTGGSEEGGVAPSAVPAAAAPAAAAPAAAAPTAATPTATATPSPTPTATPTAAPSPAPTPDAEPTKLRYNLLDTTGAAATAGSYAFLTAAGDATSAIENFGYLPGRGVELRIHPADASGASRAAFYDTVQVGDTFDYRTNGLDCGFRFKVTSLGATATPKTFEIERIRRYGTRCGDAVDNPGAPRDVEFVWRVRTGLPGADGVRVMVVDEPTGPGTYRIARDLPSVIDIPAGAEIVFEGIWINRPVVGSNLPGTTAVLMDVGTGSRLHIDPETGRDVYRFITSDEADTLFDQIAASIRRVEVGATPATTPAVCTTPADATCIVAVYKGAPEDYAQVADIPAEVLLTADADGRYRVERGQQYTVVTAAPLPAGWTRFWLELSPLEFGTPSPVSASQLIAPVGTTYTFTVTEDETASTLLTFDLKQARPFVRPRPDGKPEIGATVVTTVFSVVSCESGFAVTDPSANAELVEDCVTLLALQDTLAGDAALNWTAGQPLTAWSGVTVGGTPQRVTVLDLASSGLNGELSGLLGNLTGLTELRLNGNALTGMVPSKLPQVTTLTHLYLANNMLTGCVPPSLRTVANNDIATLGLSGCGYPTDTSYEFQRYRFVEGTYKFSIRFNGPDFTFDIPAGVLLKIRWMRITAAEPGVLPSRGLVLEDPVTGSFICLEMLRPGEECGRRVYGTEAGTLDEAFDRIVESAWIPE